MPTTVERFDIIIAVRRFRDDLPFGSERSRVAHGRLLNVRRHQRFPTRKNLQTGKRALRSSD